MARCESSAGRAELSIGHYERAIELGLERLPADHDLMVDATVSLGGSLQIAGRIADAERLLRSAIDDAGLRRREPVRIAEAMLSLAAAITQRGGDEAEIESLLKSAMELARGDGPDETPASLAARNNYAAFLMQRGRNTEAAPIAVSVMEAAERVFGPDHPHVAYASLTAGRVLGTTDQKAQAKQAVLKGLAILRARGDETLFVVEQAEGLAIQACDAAGDRASGDEHFAAWLRCRWLVAGPPEGDGVRKRLAEFRTRLAEGGADQQAVDGAIRAFVNDAAARYPVESERRARLLSNASRAIAATYADEAGRAWARELLAHARAALGTSKRQAEDQSLIDLAASEIEAAVPAAK